MKISRWKTSHINDVDDNRGDDDDVDDDDDGWRRRHSVLCKKHQSHQPA